MAELSGSTLAMATLARRNALANPARFLATACAIALPVVPFVAFLIGVVGSLDLGDISLPYRIWYGLASPFLGQELLGLLLLAVLVFLVSVGVFAVGRRASEHQHRLLLINGATNKDLQRLATFEGMLPAAAGVLLGCAIGAILAAPLAAALAQPRQTDGLTGQIRPTAFLLMVLPSLVALIGAYLATVSVARRSALEAVDTRGAAAPARWIGVPRSGWLALGAGLALFGSVGSLDGWGPGFVGYVIGVGAGLTALLWVLPRLLHRLARLTQHGPLWLGSGMAELARNRGNATVLTAAQLVLAALVMMAVSGLRSDEGVWAELSPRLVVAGVPEQDLETITETLSDHGIALGGYARLPEVYAPMTAFTRNGARANDVGLSPIVVTPEIAAAFGLDQSELNALNAGAVIALDEQFRWVLAGEHQEGDWQDPSASAAILPVHHLDGFSGAGLLLAADHPHVRRPTNDLSTKWIYVTETPMDGDASAAVDEALSAGSWQHSVGRPASSSASLERGLVGGGGFTLVALAVLGAFLASRSVRDDQATLAALGATPNALRLQLGVAAATQTLVAVVLGIAGGYLLFSVVTKSDPSVYQSLLFPWEAAGALAIVVPMLVGVLVASVLGPPKPAGSARSGSPTSL